MKASPLWTPTVKTVENLAMAKFMTEIDVVRGLVRRSSSDPYAFSKFAKRKLSAKASALRSVTGERGDGPHLELRRKFAPQEASV